MRKSVWIIDDKDLTVHHNSRPKIPVNLLKDIDLPKITRAEADLLLYGKTKYDP